MDPYEIFIRPRISEKIYNMIEDENKLVVTVHKRANKHQIRAAIETLLGVRVVKINTMITPQGHKKAIVKLSPQDNARDLAADLGLF